MRTLSIQTAAVFEPLLVQARHKGAWGGRGSGKSHFFAELGIEDALRWPGDAGEGLRWLCGREVQKSLKESAKQLIESKLAKFGLGEADGFKSYVDRISTPGDGLIVFTGLQDHTAESVKSFEGFHRFWCEEAQTVGSRSVSLIRPTIRWEDQARGLKSELWWSWNPRRKSDPVDAMLRGDGQLTDAIVVRANWSDNPWFPTVLNEERLDCLRLEPDQYDHIWEGGYVTALSGAYFAKVLAEARKENRIGPLGRDGFLPVKLFWDIGGAGKNADALAVWAVQFIGPRVHVLAYFEFISQTLDYVLTEIKAAGFAGAEVHLPHDGANTNAVTGKTYSAHIRDAGFPFVRVYENMGSGAAMLRIRAVQRLFPRIWIDDTKCSAGLDALGWYHEKRDEDRNVGLGPDHDWSSHAADGFGLMAICHNEHVGDPISPRRAYRDRDTARGGAWAA